MAQGPIAACSETADLVGLNLTTTLEVITSLSTVVALCALIWQVVESRRSIVSERSELRRRQAVLMTGWVVPAGSLEDFHGVIKNTSDLPIYDVTATLVTDKREDSLDGQEPWKVRVLPPGDQQTYDWLAISGLQGVPRLDIRFRDSAGRSWLRVDSELQEETQ